MEIALEDKRATAYHESGHAIVALSIKHSDTVDKVTIVPRGNALGATYFTPKKNRMDHWKKELIDELAISMGGYAAEQLFLGDVSTGAAQDIFMATMTAHDMVRSFGMTDALGTVAYFPGFASEETTKLIDQEVRKLLSEAQKRAAEILEAHRGQVQLMTDLLVEFETLDRDDVLDIINNQWDSSKKRERLKIAEELQKQPASL